MDYEKPMLQFKEYLSWIGLWGWRGGGVSLFKNDLL